MFWTALSLMWLFKWKTKTIEWDVNQFSCYVSRNQLCRKMVQYCKLNWCYDAVIFTFWHFATSGLPGKPDGIFSKSTGSISDILLGSSKEARSSRFSLLYFSTHHPLKADWSYEGRWLTDWKQSAGGWQDGLKLKSVQSSCHAKLNCSVMVWFWNLACV